MESMTAGRCPAGAGEVAVIVPTLRDTEAVLALFAAIEGWRSPPRQVVVACGKPDAELAHACAVRGYRYLETPANRGAQLDLGARACDAPLLWFLHADLRVPPGGIVAIRRALSAGAESGCFSFSFQWPDTWYTRTLAALVTLRVRAGGIPYGDQALFMTRRAYEESGGFPHQRLFEEVRLVKRLRRRGTFRVLEERVAVSPRRWERDGWLRRTLHNRWLAVRYTLGAPAERLASAYEQAKPALRSPAERSGEKRRDVSGGDTW